jgi:plastocyanin
MTGLGPPALAIGLLAAMLVAGQVAAADFTIAQKNRAFSARQVTIKLGDRITFVNADSVVHHLLSETKGAELDIRQAPGRSDTVRFTQPGTVVVECSIHPDMRLEVLVRQ